MKCVTSRVLNKERKGKGKSYIPSVRWRMPVRENTCPEPSAF